MPNEVRYSLTRICLKSGRLTLPLAMRDLFPAAFPDADAAPTTRREDDTEIPAVDTTSSRTHPLRLGSRRQLYGLEDFLREHALDVNDQIAFRRDPTGSIALTPHPRAKRPNASRSLDRHTVAQRVLEYATPLSEPEIRALAGNGVDPTELPLLLAADGRLEKTDGRWHRKNSPADTPAANGNETRNDTRPSGEPRVLVTSYRDTTLPTVARRASDIAHDPQLTERARTALQTFGYRTEALAPGMLLARAELGRRRHSALVHTLPEHTEIDWNAVLKRRRETASTYLAVFGSHRDLLRLTNPADVARATLWSWEALERAVTLAHSVPVTPFELEGHFQGGGLIEDGLHAFEENVGRRVTERGHLSAVLTTLATLPAPAVFLLDDVIDEHVSREQALGVLDVLALAPFHLVTRIGNGEFGLRYPAHDALSHVSDYALSLRHHLPQRSTARVTGSTIANDGTERSDTGRSDTARDEKQRSDRGASERDHAGDLVGATASR